MFSFTNIKAFHKELLEGSTTCVDAVQHFIAKIEEKKHLNAFVEVYDSEALEKASALDLQRAQGLPLKKLHGVVIAIKDVICYKGHHTTAASAILKDFTSLYTATALQYLINEEAIIIGTCNCDEFAMGSTNENSTYGNVLNPWNESKVPGGSSGGSAVALQSGMCMLSLGSDTGGSVRQPADFCGVIGLKPGYGRISRYGLIAYASSFDQIGIFGKNIEDISLLLNMMSIPDYHDSTMQTLLMRPLHNAGALNRKFKFCVFKEVLEHSSLDPEIKASLKKVEKELKTQGHQVEQVDFDLLEYIVPAYYILTTAEASSNLSRYDGIRFGHQSTQAAESIDAFYKNNRSEGFGPEVKRRIMLGTFVLSTGYYDAYYTKAQQVRRLVMQKVEAIFNEYDAIIMPSSPGTAPSIGAAGNDPVAMYLGDIFTVFANLAGLPGIALPLFWHNVNNLPYGLQVMTNKQDEVTLLEIADLILQQYPPRF